MNKFRENQTFFILSFGLHLFLITMLMWESHSERPALTVNAQQQTWSEAQTEPSKPQELIQAVAVDASEVNKAVDQLKNQRAEAARAEANRQKALQQAAVAMQQKRLEEQKQLEKLKAQAAELALKQKKKMAEEKARLEKLAKEQAQKQQELKDLQQKQQVLQQQKAQEEKRLADLQLKKAQEEAKQQQLAKQAAAKALEQQQNALKAAQEAAKKAQMAGVVDRYKALIIQAIAQQWILPEQVDKKLSSQFRIRLAPNGTVLEVTLTRSSGDPVLDRSAQSAIYKASPLPVPSDSETFNVFRDISLTVRPENIQ